MVVISCTPGVVALTIIYSVLVLTQQKQQQQQQNLSAWWIAQKGERLRRTDEDGRDQDESNEVDADRGPHSQSKSGEQMTRKQAVSTDNTCRPFPRVS